MTSSKDWKLCHLFQWKVQPWPPLCFPILEFRNSATNKKIPIIPVSLVRIFRRWLRNLNTSERFLLAHLCQTHGAAQSQKWPRTSPQAVELGLPWKSPCPLHQSWENSGQRGQEPLCKSPVTTQTLAQGSLKQRERRGNSLNCLSPEQHSSHRLVYEI